MIRLVNKIKYNWVKTATDFADIYGIMSNNGVAWNNAFSNWSPDPWQG